MSCFPLLFELPLELRSGLEMIEHQRAAGRDDHDDLLDPRGDRLFDDDLNRGRVDDRQDFLGDDLGGRAASACPTRRRQLQPSNLHLISGIAGS